MVKVRHEITAECTLFRSTLYRQDLLRGCKTLAHQHLTFTYFLVPAQRACLQNSTKSADSQFHIRSQKYSSGEGKLRLQIIGTGSWWGSPNNVGNGSREDRGEEWSIFGKKKNQHKNPSLCLSSPLHSGAVICLYEIILYVKLHLLCGLINATSTLVFSEEHGHLYSVC